MDKINFQNGASGNTPLNATNLNKMQDNVEKEFTNTSKLIYDKVITEEDVNGFDITNITLKDGKIYKIYVDGMFGGNSTNITNLKMDFNNETPTICRNWVFGSEAGEVVNQYATTEYLRILRGKTGYGCNGEIEVCYRGGFIRAICNFAGYGNEPANVVSTRVTTMLGPYTGDITKIRVSTHVENITITVGSIIKIFELP